MDLDPGTYETLFEVSNDPQYLLNVDTGRYVRVNSAFESMTGFSRDDLECGRVTPSDLVLPEDIPVMEEKKLARHQVATDRYEIRIRAQDGTVKHLEISVQRLPIPGDPLVIGHARDISARKRLEDRLKEEVELQKKRTLEAAKASVRIFQLTEKIRNVPRLTAALLDAPDENALLSKAAEMLADRSGLNYARANIYLAKSERLELRECQPKGRRRSSGYKISGSSRYARVVRSGSPWTGTKGEFIVPLRARGEVIGALEVVFDREEKVLFDDSETVRFGQEDIVRTLANTVGMMIENLRLLQKVRKQSIMDQVTQTFNRRHFDRKLSEEVRRSQRYERDLSMLMVDVDYFKDINDTWGHQVGDTVLATLGEIFKSTSRDLDIVCRYGGDEFAILLPETDGEAAAVRAERLRVLVSEHAFENQADTAKPLHLTISVGVGAMTTNHMTPGDLIRTADEACYHSKRNGRDRITYNPADPKRDS